MPLDLRAHLARVYGDDSQLLAAQQVRYLRGLAALEARFGCREAFVFRAPGRVNLIGEHTDYNHGFVLPLALDKDVLIFASPRKDNLVRLANVEPEFGARQFRIAREVPRQPLGDWANYLQGPAQLLEREHGPGLRGFDAVVDGAPPDGVPRGSGLSSSSALTVAAAVALVGVNGLPLSGAALAEACGRAEWYVGTRGGIMDQFVSVLAQRGHALFLDCRPSPQGQYSYRAVPIPPGFAVVVVDSGVRHRNTGPHFNRRVAEGRIGVRLLQQRYPGITHLRDVNDIPWPTLEPLLPETISAAELRAQRIDPETILDGGVSPQTDTFYVRRRCRHVITENNRVLASVAALRAGDMPSFGRLMSAAHISARDDYEISTPELESMVQLAVACDSVVGARLTGAGWGGCIVVVLREEATQRLRQDLVSAYYERWGLRAQVYTCRSAAGAGEVLRTGIASQPGPLRQPI